ncbi:hypothetical protein BC831DRAFT_222260 [Entophlyctis helioformis]|nr:hypothetical protein BC831DRAFT_222260 [Entophlyctis helioformis]
MVDVTARRDDRRDGDRGRSDDDEDDGASPDARSMSDSSVSVESESTWFAWTRRPCLSAWVSAASVVSNMDDSRRLLGLAESLSVSERDRGCAGPLCANVVRARSAVSSTIMVAAVASRLWRPVLPGWLFPPEPLRPWPAGLAAGTRSPDVLCGLLGVVVQVERRGV